MIARRHDQDMETHLSPRNERVVREREDALRASNERAANSFRNRSDRVAPERGGRVPAGRQAGGGLDLLVVALFVILAIGLVSLVVTTL